MRARHYQSAELRQEFFVERSSAEHATVLGTGRKPLLSARTNTNTNTSNHQHHRHQQPTTNNTGEETASHHRTERDGPHTHTRTKKSEPIRSEPNRTPHTDTKASKQQCCTAVPATGTALPKCLRRLHPAPPSSVEEPTRLGGQTPATLAVGLVQGNTHVTSHERVRH